MPALAMGVPMDWVVVGLLIVSIQKAKTPNGLSQFSGADKELKHLRLRRTDLKPRKEKAPDTKTASDVGSGTGDGAGPVKPPAKPGLS